MPTSTTPVATATTTLAGKSAKELRAMVLAKEVTAKAVIAHLAGKESLRAPSQALLDELRGVAKAPKSAPAPAKAEAPKAPAPAKAEKASSAVIEGLTARVAALEAALAALAPAAKAPVAKVAAVKAAPAAKASVLAELLADEVTEADLRADFSALTVADLREQAAACEIEGAERMSKKALVEALVEDSILAGVIVAAPVAPPAPAAKAPKAAKVAAAEVVF